MFTIKDQHKKTIAAAAISSSAKCLTVRIGSERVETLISSELFKRPESLVVTQFQAGTFSSNNTFALEDFFAGEGLKNRAFKHCRIILISSDFTLIPTAFGNNVALSALNLVNGRNQNRHLHMHLPGIDIVAGFDANWLNAIERVFPNAQIKHSAAVTLTLFQNHHSLAGADVFLQLNGSDMELCAKNEKGLLFYNIFNPQSDEDVLYYLLFALEQFSLNPQHLKLALAAEVEANSALITSIKKYVRHLQLVAHSPNLILQDDFATMPSHHYFQLLNQFLCE